MFSYYIFTFFSLITILFGFFIEKSYTYFIGWIFSKSITDTPLSKKNKFLDIQFGDYKYIYYTWLTNINLQLDKSFLLSLFETNDQIRFWDKNYQFLNKIFNTSYSLNRLLVFEDLNFFKNKNQLQNLNILQKKHLPLELNYLTFLRKNNFQEEINFNFKPSQTQS
jgi:hypothetical protein